MTMKDETPESPEGLTAEEVRTACDAFLGALNVGERMLSAYREMVEGFRASGTLVPDEEMRAKLDALESDDSVFATMDELDQLRRPKGSK